MLILFLLIDLTSIRCFNAEKKPSGETDDSSQVIPSRIFPRNCNSSSDKPRRMFPIDGLFLISDLLSP